MGMIMYASCRAGSSSSVGTKAFRKSLLFQKSFETLRKSSPWTLQLFSRCFSLSICTFVSLPSFYQCFLGFFFPHFLCLSIKLYGSHLSPIFIFQPFLTQRRCLWRTQMHIAAALSGSSRPLDKGRAQRLLVLTVSLPFTGIRLFSVTLRLPLSWLLQPKLATILPSGAELTHTKPHTQLDLKMAFLSNSVSQLRWVP